MSDVGAGLGVVVTRPSHEGAREWGREDARGRLRSSSAISGYALAS